MQLSAVLLARVIGFVEMNDLNPRGSVRLPVVASMLAEKYRFLKCPEKPEDFDEAKGVEFTEGVFEGIGIDKLTIWHNGIGIDLRSSTDDAKKILLESLEWLKADAGITFEPKMIKQWAYLSHITFYSDADFGSIHPALKKLEKRLTSAVSDLQGIDFDFRTNFVGCGYDRTLRKFPVSDFSIQRRADTPYAEGKYFSHAPLPTQDHIELLRLFEADVIG
jgi:hypothetical protein